MKEDVYRELVRRSAHDVDEASYVLLLQACRRVMEEMPDSIEQLDDSDKKDRLSRTVACLMEALTHVIPYPELIHYLPEDKRLPWPFVL